MPELNTGGQANSYNEVDTDCNASPPNGAPAGTFPNQAEGIWRALMGALQRFWDRINGTVTTTGSAGAYVYTPANTSFPTAYVQGETYVWRANFTAVGSDTLNVNSLGAKGIYKATTSGMVAIGAGDIQNGQIVHTVYDGNLNSSAGGFQLIGTVIDVTAEFEPSELATKSTPTTSDSVVIMDAADSSAAKTSTVSAIIGLVTGLPAGTILDFAGTTAPSGYLECDGSAVSRTDHADLFAAIGTSWGSGDGSTTFNVPNLNGTVTAGRNGSFSFGNDIGDNGGEYTHTLSSSEAPVHNHTASSSSSASPSGSGSFPVYQMGACGGATNEATSGGVGTGTGTVSFGLSLSTSVSTSTSVGNSSGGSAHNNVQPTAVVMKIIKT